SSPRWRSFASSSPPSWQIDHWRAPSQRRPPVGAARAKGAGSGSAGSSGRLSLEHAAAHLVQLDGFEQRLEVALAETLVALALDDLDKDRADLVFGEDLQQ